MPETRPNILLLHCHDLGQHLSCYGCDVATPTIDSLAAAGVRFEEYYCTAPQCGPSRSSIHTGRHPHENGLMGHHWLGWDIDDDVATLPQLLRDEGYHTTTFGIQHLSDDATEAGYLEERSDTAWCADIVPAFEDYVAERADEDAPFFASLGFFEPHRLSGRLDLDGYDAPDPRTVDVPPYLPDVPVVREQVAGAKGMIQAVDDAVARTLDAVEAEGIADETVVIFTTDHGLALPRAKGMCYDPGIETALIMRYPGVFDGGETYDELLSNVDLLPTLLDLLNIDVPDGVAGRSFLPLVTDGAEYNEREQVFVEMTYHDKYNPMRGIRTQNYKYVRTFDDQPLVYLPKDILTGPDGRQLYENYYSQPRPEEELYDLQEDPHEQQNLIDDPEYEQIATALREQVEEWMYDTDDPLLAGDVPVPEEHIEVLRTTPW